MPSTSSDRRKIFLLREKESLPPNLEGSWRYKVTVFRRNNALEAPDFNNLVTAETDGVIKQQDEFLYLELPPDGTRPEPGYLLGLVTRVSTNSILGQERIKLDLVDFDDNGMFSLLNTKSDLDGNIIELQGTYRESGFSGPSTQLQTIGKVSLTKIL